MADFFRHLAARAVGRVPRLEPMRASRYETGADTEQVVEEIEEFVEPEAEPMSVPRAPLRVQSPSVPPIASLAPLAADAPLVAAVPGKTQLETPIPVVAEDPLAGPLPESPSRSAPEPRQEAATIARSIARVTAARPPRNSEPFVASRPTARPEVAPELAPREDSASRPIVVRIGRVDVRAIMPPAAPISPPVHARERRPGPTLEEHLRRRGAELQ